MKNFNYIYSPPPTIPVSTKDRSLVNHEFFREQIKCALIIEIESLRSLELNAGVILLNLKFLHTTPH